MKPYRSTPVFDETTLPSNLREEHRTAAGKWGVIRVLEGCLLLRLRDEGREVMLTPNRPGVVQPGQPHFVTPLDGMRMQIDFYDMPPLDIASS